MLNDFKGGPWIGGWIMAAMVGVIAFALAWRIGGYDLTPAVAIAGLVALVTGLVMNWAGADAAPINRPTIEAAPVVAPPAPTTVPFPVAVPAPAPLVQGAARKPEALTAARGGKADDLKIIKGIGPKLETVCQSLGFYHFDQIANWSADEIAWVDDNLEGFKGRVTRDRWVAQARAVVDLGPKEFLAQLDAGKEF